MKNSKSRQSGNRFKGMQIEIFAVFAAIILIVIFLLDYVILKNSRIAMEQNASNLIAANSRQIQLNINSYLERLETVPTLLFSNENYYLYDATDENIEDYDKVKNEELILDRIVDIGLMDNYSDFGIVYSDDHAVGWISHGTEDIFPEGGMYDKFSGYIKDSPKSDGWCFDVNGCIDRIYYIKRLNKNAILESATYTRELSSVFVYPEQLEEMTIRLVNQDNEIIYSSDENEIGEELPEDILSEMKVQEHEAESEDIAEQQYDTSIIGDKYIINENECGNGWRVICCVPTEVILKSNTQMSNFILKISVFVALIFVLTGLEILLRIYRPMDVEVQSLKESAEIDKLSGVRNKTAFQKAVEAKMYEKGVNDLSILTMIDVDNFKQINDRLGHSHGDQVIIRTGELLKRVYDPDTLIGRMGGDEFATYSLCFLSDDEISDDEYSKDRTGVISAAKHQLDKLMKEFDKEFAEEKKTCDISLSLGVYITDRSSGIHESFKVIYDKADEALYSSKRAGKSRYTFYDPVTR